MRAVDRHLGIATEARIGSTDANLPLSLGVPALAIGAGGVGWGIHTLQEGYDPTGRDLALRRLNVDVVHVQTDRPYVDALIAFFKARAKRQAHG